MKPTPLHAPSGLQGSPRYHPSDTPAARIEEYARFALARLAALRRPLNRDEERMHDVYTTLLERRREQALPRNEVVSLPRKEVSTNVSGQQPGRHHGTRPRKSSEGPVQGQRVLTVPPSALGPVLQT
jgi:hypothetical protein